MPIYEYLCPKCGHKFEVKQNFTDNEIVKCPECNTMAEKQMSSFSFTFAQPMRKSRANPNARQVKPSELEY